MRVIISGLTLALVAGFAGAGNGTWPLFESGVKAYRRGEYKSAQRRFEGVIRSDPSFGDAFYYLGVLQERKRDRRGAVAYFKAVTKKWPTFALSQERLGQIALQLHEPKAAEKYFLNVVEAAPGVNAWMELGGVQLDLEKYKLAEESLSKGAKLGRDNLNLIELQARLYSQTNRHQLAYDAYSRIVKVMPQDANARYLRALCLSEMKRSGDAVTEMEAVLKLDPYHKGCILRLLAAYEDDPARAEETATLRARLEQIRKSPPRVRRVSGSTKK